MKKLPTLFILALAVAFILAASVSGFAEGMGTVNQVGISNHASVYQEVMSEVIIMQLGNENEVSVEQVGAEHIAGVGQIGDENEMVIQQLGQRDLVFSLQFGMGNYGNVTQMHSTTLSSSYGNVSNNDTFTYQSGLYNILNLMQIGDDNTASVYQVDNNNETFIIQEQNALASGGNAAFVVQLGIGSWVASQQLGANEVNRVLQMGDDNSALVSQNGIDDNSVVLQTGNQNSAIINQG